MNETLEKILDTNFGVIVLFSDYPKVFVDFDVNIIQPVSAQEMENWLQKLNVPQLADSNYWRQYADCAIWGGWEEQVNVDGKTSTPYFKITFSHQKSLKFKDRYLKHPQNKVPRNITQSSNL